MKVFKIQVSMDTDTGVDFNSFVMTPAHMRAFHAFGAKNETELMQLIGKRKDVYSINEEKHMVTGCMINTNYPIERFDKEIGTHYVIFDAQSVDVINKKIAIYNFANNVNVNHDMTKVQKGLYQTHRWQVSNSDPLFPKVPEAFTDQKIGDMSLFCTYWIDVDTEDGKKLWQDVKDGKFQGFSVEGWFDKVEVSVKKKDRIKKIKLAKGKFAKISEISKWEIEIDQDTVEVGTALTRTWNSANNPPEVSKIKAGEYSTSDGKRILVDSDGIVRLIFKTDKMSKKPFSFRAWFNGESQDEEPQETFGTATTVDGVVLKWSGDLATGTAITMEVEGVETPAPEGDHEITLEDGTKKVITLDGTGAVTAITDVQEMDDVEAVAEFAKELTTFVKDGFSQFKADFEALKLENQSLKAEIEAIRKGEKFEAKPKGGEQDTVKQKMEVLKKALRN